MNSSTLCPAGQCWYCTLKSGCRFCSAGSFCPGDDYQYSCPVNTYNALTSSTDSSDCLSCPEGKISDAGSSKCSYEVTVVAGIGGYTGSAADGVQGVAANLNNVRGVVLDKLGNLYFSDSGNNRIRSINIPTGILSTYAGTGVAGSSGDNSAATLATLSGPYDITFDTSWNLYIADTGNHRVRVISKSTGIITTIAGTGTGGYSGDGISAVSTQLNTPKGVAVDASGNVYIADTGNHRIRLVNKVSGIISTFVGTGSSGYGGDNGAATSAMLNSPIGVDIDNSGNIIVCDSSNYRIRKVNKNTCIIVTIVGTGASATSSEGLAVAQASIGTVYQVSFDTSGVMYFADYTWNVVRMLSLSGNVTTLSGVQSSTAAYSGYGGPTSSAGLANPAYTAVDIYGNVYFTETSGNVIREVLGRLRY